MSTEPLDPAAIMAEHRADPWRTDQRWCKICGPLPVDHRACETFRLAEALMGARASAGANRADLAAAREREQRVRVDVLDRVRSMPLGYRPQDVADELDHADFRAALAGESTAPRVLDVLGVQPGADVRIPAEDEGAADQPQGEPHFHGCPTPTGRPFDCDYCQERTRSMNT